MDASQLRARLADLHPLSLGWALSCCRHDPALAEDVLQSAYLKVLEGRARFEGRATFKTWFFGVVRNSAREERRRHLMRRAGLLRYEPSQQNAPSPDGSLAREESRAEIRTALEGLSPRQQEILHLVFYQDLTIEEASTVMNISLGSARKHYDRGKRNLRKNLSKNTP